MSYAEHIVRVQWYERMPSSRNGNPRWRLHTNLGSYVTQSDSMIGYHIEGLFGEGEESYIDHPVRFHLTSSGRVYNITTLPVHTCEGSD